MILEFLKFLYNSFLILFTIVFDIFNINKFYNFDIIQFLI